MKVFSRSTPRAQDDCPEFSSPTPKTKRGFLFRKAKEAKQKRESSKSRSNDQGDTISGKTDSSSTISEQEQGGRNFTTSTPVMPHSAQESAGNVTETQDQAKLQSEVVSPNSVQEHVENLAEIQVDPAAAESKVISVIEDERVSPDQHHIVLEENNIVKVDGHHAVVEHISILSHGNLPHFNSDGNGTAYSTLSGNTGAQELVEEHDICLHQRKIVTESHDGLIIPPPRRLQGKREHAADDLPPRPPSMQPPKNNPKTDYPINASRGTKALEETEPEVPFPDTGNDTAESLDLPGTGYFCGCL